jgi:hypothetical protein
MDSMRASYRTRSWYPILAVWLGMVSFILVKTGRDAVFFDQAGLQRLPLAYIWTALASFPMAILHLRAMARWGSRSVRVGVFVLTAAVLLLFVPWTDREHRLALTLLFVLVPVLYAAVFGGAWLLGADLLEAADPATVRWAYTGMGVGSILGGIAGGLLAKALALVLSADLLLAAGAAVLLLAAGLCLLAHRRHPAPLIGPPLSGAAGGTGVDTAVGRTLETAQAPVQPRLLDQPYIRALIGMSALGSLIGMFVDFQFYAIAAVSGSGGMQFFANFYVLLNLCSLALQCLVAPRLQDRLGIAGALAVLPLALLGGAGFVTLSTTLVSRSILKVAEGGLRSSIYRSIWEQVFLPIDRARRGVAKTLVDGVCARISEGIGATLLYLWILRNPTLEQMSRHLGWISWVVAAAALAWIGLTVHLKRLGCRVTPENYETMLRLPDA